MSTTDSSLFSYAQEEQASSARVPMKFEDPYFEFNSGLTMASARDEMTQEEKQVRVDDSAPTPPPFNPILQTTRVVPASQASLVVSAAGGGLASDEDNLSLPVHTMDMERMRPMLTYLVYAYDVEMVSAWAAGNRASAQ